MHNYHISKCVKKHHFVLYYHTLVKGPATLSVLKHFLIWDKADLFLVKTYAEKPGPKFQTLEKTIEEAWKKENSLWVSQFNQNKTDAFTHSL